MTIHKFTPWAEEEGTPGIDCGTCLHGESPTPMLFAFVTMNIAPHQRQELMDRKLTVNETFFSNGWTAGIEGDSSGAHAPFVGTVNKFFDYDDTRAWLVGYIAGRYASENEWLNPVCRLTDVSDHTPDPLRQYASRIESAGDFPRGSLRGDVIARGIIQVLMEADTEPFMAAGIIGQAVSQGTIKVKTATRFDSNPTVDSRDLNKSYAEYIAILDERHLGWYWTTMRFAAPEMRKAAIERRMRVIARPR